MQLTKTAEAEADSTGTPSTMGSRKRLQMAGNRFFAQLPLGGSRSSRTLRRRHALCICAFLFLVAVGVRLLHWQDSYVEIARGEPWMSDLVRQYIGEAQRMREGGGILFPREKFDPGDARFVVHPPGYSMLMAAVFSFVGDSNSAMRWVQIVCDGFSVVMVFLIACELLNAVIAMMAGLLAALSPHLAFYSLWLSPDSLPVLPILIAIYLLIKASQRPRLKTVIGAGMMIGVSCWLRANALLLAPFLAMAEALLLVRGKRLRYGLALVSATVVMIAPITIRNWVMFHRFIPLSIAGGENLVVGIGDFDKEGRFGMPTSDDEAGYKDAEWHNRPEYSNNLWVPDGIERDQYRYARGLKLISAHPFWFAGVMLRRAAFMLNYNNSCRADWPFNTATVPIISREAAPGHAPVQIGDAVPIWSTASSEWLSGDVILSEHAEVCLADDPQTLRIAGDASEFGDQFASASVVVKPKMDYLLTLRIKLDNGNMAVKVTSADRRLTLASDNLDRPSVPHGSTKRMTKEGPDSTPTGSTTQPEMNLTQLAFASGDRSKVRLVISNNGPASLPRVARVAKAELFELGATPNPWTRYLRGAVRGLQKNLFKTTIMLPLVIAGAILLSLAGRRRALVVLLAVPAYYLCFQSALSTEYRYILAIHYFLFIMSASAVYCGVVASYLVFIRWRNRSAASIELAYE